MSIIICALVLVEMMNKFNAEEWSLIILAVLSMIVFSCVG